MWEVWTHNNVGSGAPQEKQWVRQMKTKTEQN